MPLKSVRPIRILNEACKMTYAVTTSRGTGYTAATAKSLNSAISSLGDDGGTVLVWSDIQLEDAIIVQSSNINIDFMGHTATILSHSSLAQFCHFRRSEGSRICNVHIQPLVGSIKPILLFKPDSSGFVIRDTVIEDMIVENAGKDQGSEWTAGHGIVLSGVDPRRIDGNTFRRIRMKGVNSWLVFETPTNSSSISDNYFQDIFVDGFISFMTFPQVTATNNKSINRNLFTHVRGCASEYTQHGIGPISGDGNHFDHVSIDKWSERATVGSDDQDWKVDQSATNTYISAHVLTEATTDSEDTIYDPAHPGSARSVGSSTAAQRIQAGRSIFADERRTNPLLNLWRHGR